jgi:hypothetical protein
VNDIVYQAITKPERLWSPAELRVRPSPVPAEPGVYAWFFDVLPAAFDVDGCIETEGKTLLYVGIAPAFAGSKSHLRKRLRQHYRDRGSSTLRRTLAALLAERLDLVPGSGTRGRLKIGDEGESRLSDWIASNAAVTWVATPQPWLVERDLVWALNLPLNLMHNMVHPFAKELSHARADARRLLLGASPNDLRNQGEGELPSA